MEDDHRVESLGTEEDPLATISTPSFSGRYDSDVQKLRKALSNEKFAPTILQFETSLFTSLSNAIQETEHALTTAIPDAASTLRNDMQWTSLNRAKYLLRAYLRTRLWKIEEHVMHILMPENNLFDRLSEEERTYATKYTGVLDEHLQSSLLSRMPAGFTSLVHQKDPEESEAETERGFDMIPEPNLDAYVFCRPLVDIGSFDVDGQEFDLAAMKTYMMRYRNVQRLVESHQMELL